MMIILYAADVYLDWVVLFDDVWHYLKCNDSIWLVPGTEIE